MTDTDTGLIRLNAEDSDERVYDGQFSLTVIKLQGEIFNKKIVSTIRISILVVVLEY